MTHIGLAAKAEVVFGAQLVMRHRSPRLAVLLCLLVIGMAVARGRADTVAGLAETALLVAGTLGAVGGSRLLAPGAALAAARRVAAGWWVVSTGRLIGALLVTLPIVAVAVLAVGAEASPGKVGLVAMIYAAAVVAAVIAGTPLVGASAAAGLGLVGTWLGGIGPSGVSVMFESWPAVRGPVVLLWNVLPLEWRAARWLGEPNATDCIVLLSWIVLGLILSVWTTAVRFRSEAPSVGDVA